MGAYVGLYSLWSSKLIGDGGLVVAFESNPESYYWLKNNIELNKAYNVYALPYALGDTLSTTKLYVPKVNVEASSLIPGHLVMNPMGNIGIAKQYNIPVITLDYFLVNSKVYYRYDILMRLIS